MTTRRDCGRSRQRSGSIDPVQAAPRPRSRSAHADPSPCAGTEAGPGTNPRQKLEPVPAQKSCTHCRTKKLHTLPDHAGRAAPLP